MIKFALRRNLIYPFQLIIWNLIRQIETIIMKESFNYSNSLTFTPIMYIGEISGGAIVYFYQKKNNLVVKKKKKIDEYFKTIRLLTNEEDETDYFIPVDNTIKVLFLIIVASFFDSVQFMIWAIYLPKMVNLSSSIIGRLSGFSTIFASLFYYYVLKLPLLKHQIFSLIAIGICSSIVIVIEFCFQDFNIFMEYKDLAITMIFIMLSHFFAALVDSIEKYLFEYDFVNPFIVLIYEGIFGFFTIFYYFFAPVYLEDFVIIYKTQSSGGFVLFVFLLFIYIILCGLRNVFKMATTKIYSPMTRTLTDYVLNPFYLLYYYFFTEDFISNKEKSLLYFLLNVFLSIIISFFGCVYNEFIIIFLFGLERDTHDQISKRAKVSISKEINKIEIRMDEIMESDDDSVNYQK